MTASPDQRHAEFDGGWEDSFAISGEAARPWLKNVPEVDAADPRFGFNDVQAPPELGRSLDGRRRAGRCGLAAAGLTAEDPQVQGHRVLRTHQLPDGSWWGR